MRRISDGKVAILAASVFAFWLFVVLPFLYSVPRYDNKQNQPTHSCSAEESKNHGFWEKADCDPVAYFTLWLVAFTGVLAFSTIGLWWVTWRAARGQDRDTRILERAYLTIEGDGVRAFLDGTDRLSCGIRYHNNGNLPAEEVHMFHDRKFSANRFENNFPIGEVGKGSIYIAPKAIALGGAQHLSKHELLKWKPCQGQPENWLFVWGRVPYLDGFGDARFIDFCHRYNLSGSGPGGVMDASACRYHEYGNRTGKLPKGAHGPAA